MNKPNQEASVHGGSRLAYDNGHDNTELANALLSLGARYTIPDVLDSSFKETSTYGKPDCIQMAVTTPPTFGLASPSAASLSRANAWVGGSAAALLGYPYSSYGIDPVAFCSCATRVGPSLPGWKSYQQSGVPEFSTVSSGMYQPALRYPQPLHHPLIFAANNLQQNLQKYNPMESRNSLALPLHPQQQTAMHDQQVPIAIQQQPLVSKQLKISADIANSPSCMKQDSPTRSSVAVVAPLIVEFNQKSQMPGIPVIYNVNQWMNVPPCSNGTAAPASVKTENGVTQMQQQDYINTQMSCPSWQSVQPKRDAICQLGEAANMILQCQDAAPKGHRHTVNHVGTPDRKHYQGCCAVTKIATTDPSIAKNSDANQNISKEVVAAEHSTHTGHAPKNLKNRTCPYCNKVFARPFTLKSHIRRHTKEKPYVCKTCQRSFSQNATLENHKLIHTGAKPHQCGVCMKRFAHQTSLKTHLRIHTGEQPYECEFCSRRFTDGSTLQKHKRTHNGDKPFPCRFCKKCFSQSGNMRRHMTTTHKEELRLEEASKTLLKYEGSCSFNPSLQ